MGAGTGALVTKTLIGINVAVFLISIAEGSGGFQPAQSFINRWALNGFAVSEGEWYRLITSAFLHASVLHIAFNMLMLWWFGQALESALGRARFLGIYLVSALAGSAGALLLSGEFVNTVGASGAVFGILGAGLVLERKQVYVFGGGALFVVILNVAFTFAVSNISIGGHLGGLAGGVLRDARPLRGRPPPGLWAARPHRGAVAPGHRGGQRRRRVPARPRIFLSRELLDASVRPSSR